MDCHHGLPAGFRLISWNAWMPDCETPEGWQTWAKNRDRKTLREKVGHPHPPVLPPPAPAPNIPPMLRRRAGRMGRAALHVLSDDTFYQGQPVIMCSRFGEFPRALEIKQELAQSGGVSPQQFSMSVHNATGGLFMISQKSQAPLTALSATEDLVLSGLQETFSCLVEGIPSVWLMFCDEPLPEVYRSLSEPFPHPTDDFAVRFELAAGEDFYLARGNANSEKAASAHPLDLLRFFLCGKEPALFLSARTGMSLYRRTLS